MTPAAVPAAATWSTRAAGATRAAETAASIPLAPAAPSTATAEPADTEGRQALPGQEVAAGGGGSLDPARAAGHA
jgi:hypothetical protein